MSVKKYEYMSASFIGQEFVAWLNEHGAAGWCAADIKHDVVETLGLNTYHRLDVIFVRELRGNGDM